MHTPAISSLTLDAFIEQYAGKRYEYVDGLAVPMGLELIDENGDTYVPPPKYVHGIVTARILKLLLGLVDPILGEFLIEMGFLMHARELRAADIAFVTTERLPKVTPAIDWLPFPPDFAVEVISEWDKAAEVRRKNRSYMTYGTRLLWVVYPLDREIEVYRPAQEMEVVRAGDFLDGGAVLPGLRLAVGDIFSVLED